MIETPTIVDTKALVTAVIRLKIPSSEIRQAMGAGVQELFATVAAQGIKPSGPWYTYHYHRPTDVFDFEIGVPVPTAVKPAGRVTPGELRAARVARTVYQGGYEGLGGGWGELMTWIESNGHKTGKDLWEFYVVGPESGSDSSKYRTELNKPLIA